MMLNAGRKKFKPKYKEKKGKLQIVKTNNVYKICEITPKCLKM